MAKLRGVITPSGKLGDEVYVESRYGRYVRKAIKPGIKKNEPALKKQYNRTAYLNKLASEINTVIAHAVPEFKDREFYHRMQSLFRREPQDNRFFLLQQLKYMEVNPRYKLEKLHYGAVTASQKTKSLEVTIHVSSHPHHKRRFDCYDYELYFLYWNKTGKAVLLQKQLSPWIFKNEPVPGIHFSFSKPTAATQWLLFLRLRLGVNKKHVGFIDTQGMQVVEVGSFDKKDDRAPGERKPTKRQAGIKSAEDNEDELRVGVVKRK